ncbi:hypothetical protein Tco_1102177 [Tanacetum coccineum]
MIWRFTVAADLKECSKITQVKGTMLKDYYRQYQILKGIERIEAQGGEVQHIESEAIIEGGRDLRGQLRARP